jgi:hypothetical protein
MYTRQYSHIIWRWENRVSLDCMDDLVLAQGASFCERLPADTAAEGPLTSVRTSMHSQLTRGSEPLPTVLTRERLLASVGSTDVLIQVSRTGERSVTVSTGVRALTSVGSEMPGEVTRIGKRCTTTGTLNRLLPGVRASVQSQLISSSKHATAVTTLEGPVRGVHCSGVL